MQPCTISITSHRAINTPLCWPDRTQIFDAAKVCNSIRGFLCRYGGFGTRVPLSPPRSVGRVHKRECKYTHVAETDRRKRIKEKKEKKREKREDRRDDGIISSGKAGNVHRVNIGDRIGNCVGMFNEGVGKCHAVKMSEQHPSNRMLPTLAPTYCRCIVHQVTLSRFRVIFTLMGIEGRTVRYVKKAFSYSHPLFFNGVPCWWKMVSFLGREFSLREFIFFVLLEFYQYFFPLIIGCNLA